MNKVIGNTAWLKDSALVILCAGRGKRMGGNEQKVLLDINGIPIFQHVLNFWQPYIKDIVFVVGYRAPEVEESIFHLANKGCIRVVVQKEQIGIADAIYQARNHVPEKFVVALGDCLNIGTFEIPENMQSGYALWRSDYHEQLALCCSAWCENGTIVRIVEKGRAPFVGIGTYFFEDKVFDYIRQTKPSAYRNEVEITQVLQNMIDYGERLSPVYFKGEFINVTYPEDVKQAEKIIGGE